MKTKLNDLKKLINDNSSLLADNSNRGLVTTVIDGVAKIIGLQKVKFGEMRMALNIFPSMIVPGIILFLRKYWGWLVYYLFFFGFPFFLLTYISSAGANDALEEGHALVLHFVELPPHSGRILYYVTYYHFDVPFIHLYPDSLSFINFSFGVIYWFISFLIPFDLSVPVVHAAGLEEDEALGFYDQEEGTLPPMVVRRMDSQDSARIHGKPRGIWFHAPFIGPITRLVVIVKEHILHRGHPTFEKKFNLDNEPDGSLEFYNRGLTPRSWWSKTWTFLKGLMWPAWLFPMIGERVLPEFKTTPHAEYFNETFHKTIEPAKVMVRELEFGEIREKELIALKPVVHWDWYAKALSIDKIAPETKQLKWELLDCGPKACLIPKGKFDYPYPVDIINNDANRKKIKTFVSHVHACIMTGTVKSTSGLVTYLNYLFYQAMPNPIIRISFIQEYLDFTIQTLENDPDMYICPHYFDTYNWEIRASHGEKMPEGLDIERFMLPVLEEVSSKVDNIYQTLFTRSEHLKLLERRHNFKNWLGSSEAHSLESISKFIHNFYRDHCDHTIIPGSDNQLNHIVDLENTLLTLKQIRVDIEQYEATGERYLIDSGEECWDELTNKEKRDLLSKDPDVIVSDRISDIYCTNQDLMNLVDQMISYFQVTKQQVVSTPSINLISSQLLGRAMEYATVPGKFESVSEPDLALSYYNIVDAYCSRFSPTGTHPRPNEVSSIQALCSSIIKDFYKLDREIRIAGERDFDSTENLESRVYNAGLRRGLPSQFKMVSKLGYQDVYKPYLYSGIVPRFSYMSLEGDRNFDNIEALSWTSFIQGNTAEVLKNRSVGPSYVMLKAITNSVSSRCHNVLIEAVYSVPDYLRNGSTEEINNKITDVLLENENVKTTIRNTLNFFGLEYFKQNLPQEIYSLGKNRNDGKLLSLRGKLLFFDQLCFHYGQALKAALAFNETDISYLYENYGAVVGNDQNKLLSLLLSTEVQGYGNRHNLLTQYLADKADSSDRLIEPSRKGKEKALMSLEEADNRRFSLFISDMQSGNNSGGLFYPSHLRAVMVDEGTNSELRPISNISKNPDVEGRNTLQNHYCSNEYRVDTGRLNKNWLTDGWQPAPHHRLPEHDYAPGIRHSPLANVGYKLLSNKVINHVLGLEKAVKDVPHPVEIFLKNLEYSVALGDWVPLDKGSAGEHPASDNGLNSSNSNATGMFYDDDEAGPSS